MTILDDPIVQKYFRHCDDPKHGCDSWRGDMTVAVLAAMSQPIRKGEKCLAWNLRESAYIEEDCDYDFDGRSIHSGWLLLPDRFQEREKCEHPWGGINYFQTKPGFTTCTVCDKELELPILKPAPEAEAGEPIPDALEKAILSVAKIMNIAPIDFAGRELRELIRLARESKP
jgi:hypothetical protein